MQDLLLNKNFVQKSEFQAYSLTLLIVTKVGGSTNYRKDP